VKPKTKAYNIPEGRLAEAMRLAALQNSAWLEVTPLPGGLYEVRVKNEPRAMLRQLSRLTRNTALAHGTRRVELIICRPYDAGDCGDWHTEYVRVPVDTPDENAEAAAIAAWHAEHDGAPGQSNVAHIGLYYLPPVGDDEEPEDDDSPAVATPFQPMPRWPRRRRSKKSKGDA
jgi:hypothetical protein